MDYVKGIFKNRPNRFIAEVEVDGNLEKAHVPNTGRCKELLVDGVVTISHKLTGMPSDVWLGIQI